MLRRCRPLRTRCIRRTRRALWGAGRPRKRRWRLSRRPLHRVVPAFLERTGDEAVAGVSLLITALCQVGFVAGTLDPSVPLRRNYSVTFLQVSQRCEREFDRQRRDGSQQTFTNRVIERLCRQAHAVWLQCLAMPPVALVDRVQAAIALIAHR